MKPQATNQAPVIQNGTQRLSVEMSDEGLVARLITTDRSETRQPVILPLRFATLRSGSAEPVVVYPAWAPGKPETNFARFRTDLADTYDAFEAGVYEGQPITRVVGSDDASIACESDDGRLRVTVSAQQVGFRVSWAFAVPDDGVWSVVFDPFNEVDDEAVRAILAGPFLTERRLPVIAGILPEGWTAAPFTLVETRPDATALTTYLAIPPEFPAWDWGVEQRARYGLGSRGKDGTVSQFVMAPLLGNPGSHVRAGDTLAFDVLVGVEGLGWWETWRKLAFDVYGLRSYRQNVDGSMTDAVLNMVDLLKDDEYSGWMERGRGFLNLEHRDGVKLASPGAVISAALLTGDRDLMEIRALPIVEYSISRSHYGFTWSPGSRTVGEDHVRQAFEDLGGPAWDSPVLVALHALSRGYTPALHELAVEAADGISDFYIRRSDFQVSLSLFALTGEQEYLDRARAEADAYIVARIDTLNTEPVEGQRFLIHIGPDWMSMLDLWEFTQDRRFLDAADRGARWMAVQMWLGPVPDAETAGNLRQTATPSESAARIGMFDRHMFDNADGPSSWMRDLVDYPRTVDTIQQETVPAWQPSPIGMSFEAWCTYWGRLVMNPGWAPYFLRLASATGDSLYRTIAENAVVGRFTNYPGYYQYLPTVVQGKADFPYQGPMDLTSIYYHHIPPQLGIAIDYLVEEMRDRSGGRIAFPIARDDSYVQFRHHLPGIAPGRFYDIEDSWPWLPRDVVTVDTHSIDWLAAIDTVGRRLGIALANGSGFDVTATPGFNLERLGVDDVAGLTATILDANGDRITTVSLANGKVPVSVPARGLVAIRIDGVCVEEPWHSVDPVRGTAPESWITMTDGDPNFGTVRAAIVGFEPGNQSAYVFSTAMPDCATRLDVHWEQGEASGIATADRFPFEISIPMTSDSIRVRVAVTGVDGQRHESGQADLRATRRESGS